MKKWLVIMACLAFNSVWAAEQTKSVESKPADSTQQPVKKEAPKKSASKKQPGTMEKAGSKVKSGWNKLTHDVKQGVKKPACTDAQRSLKQCN